MSTQSNQPTGQPRQSSFGVPQNERDDKANPAPPEQSNRDHPVAPGAAMNVEGEGIVSTGTTARGARRDTPDHERETRGKAPNDPDAPGQVVPTGSAGAAARETSDPNFTAATRPRSDVDAGASMNPNVTPTRHPRRNGPARHARDLMSANLEVASPDTELYYVARMMAERDIGAVPIVDSTDTMRPVGILTDRDIVVRVIAKNQTHNELRAGDVMTPSVVTVREDASVDELAHQMQHNQLRRILVTDDQGRVVGIVAQADLATRGSETQVADVVTDVSKPD
jgi:CBS domain-containing protein